MSSNLHVPHPEWGKMIEKHEALVSQIASVIAEAHALADSIPVVLARYARAFGDRLVKLQELEIETARCKREIELLQSVINHGGNWDYASIQEKVDAEFYEWQEKLDREAKQFQEQQGLLHHLLDEETTRALRDQFRVLARRLHPDLHPQQTPAEAELWHRVSAAYDQQNLEELEAIEVITREQTRDDLPRSLDDMSETVQRLETKLKSLLTNLSHRRKSWPLDQLIILDSQEATAKKQKDLEARMEELTLLRDQRRSYLDHLLGS